jgi:pyruvate kinase
MNIQNDELKLLIEELEAIRQSALDLEAEVLPRAQTLHPTYTQSARNLLHYLALRRHELRPLQKRLSALGLSSLGRTESHVLASVDRVLETLHHLAGIPPTPQVDAPPVNGFEEGAALLEQHTEALLGPTPDNRVTRIMVTMPTEAADDPAVIAQLLSHGMNCMRINCAHDDAAKWRRMIEHLRRAEQALGLKCRIMMDLAGPKLRTGQIEPGEQVIRWKPRRNRLGQVTAPARIWLFPKGDSSGVSAPADACVPVSGPWLKRLQTGDRIGFVDARGSRRVLRVVASEGCGRWAEAIQTAYVIPGTILRVRKRNRKVQSKPAVHETKLGAFPALEQVLELQEGDLLILTNGDVPGRPAQRGPNGAVMRPAQIGCTLPAIFADVRAGQSIWFDDGRIGGTIESVETGRIHVRIVQARVRGERLRADKGINLPESVLSSPGLTEKDIKDLPFIAAHADMVGYSFVRTPADVEALEARLQELGGKNLGIVLKIETRLHALAVRWRDDRARRPGHRVRLRAAGGGAGADPLDLRSRPCAGHLGHAGVGERRERRSGDARGSLGCREQPARRMCDAEQRAAHHPGRADFGEHPPPYGRTPAEETRDAPPARVGPPLPLLNLVCTCAHGPILPTANLRPRRNGQEEPHRENDRPDRAAPVGSGSRLKQLVAPLAQFRLKTRICVRNKSAPSLDFCDHN